MCVGRGGEIVPTRHQLARREVVSRDGCADIDTTRSWQSKKSIFIGLSFVPFPEDVVRILKRILNSFYECRALVIRQIEKPAGRRWAADAIVEEAETAVNGGGAR